MSLPRPIRYDRDTWLCMRGHPVLPAAIVRRVTVTDRFSGCAVEKFRVVTWELDPDQRTLVGYFDELDAANESVLFARPVSSRDTSTFSGYPGRMTRGA